MTHWKEFKQVLRYLKETKDIVLFFESNRYESLSGFVDASYAEDIERRSSSGYVFLYNHATISWRNKKLDGASISSTESEFRAYLGACQESVQLKSLEYEIYKIERKSVQIFSDNQSAIALSKNKVFHNRTKHIDVHYQFVRDLMNNEKV